MAGQYVPAATIYVEINDRRTPDQKRQLARLLTDACVEVLGVNAEDVSIRFRIFDYQSMARGGMLLADRESQGEPHGS